MSATTTFTSQVVSEWVKIFPRQVTETYTSSVTFMKQLTVIAISTITYLKNAFPEDSYTIENFGGIRLRSLKNKCRDELAQFVSSALTQAFEAFDKKYLQQLVLCFYEGERRAENLAEYHMFEYSYSGARAGVEVVSRARADGGAGGGRGPRGARAHFSLEDVRESTLHLIRSCVVLTQTCHALLPDSYDISIRLYYNEDAPEGYQAPGFYSSEEDEDHLVSTLNDTIKFGWVETPFHKMIGRMYVRDSVGSSREAIASQNAPPISQMEQDDFDVSAGQVSVSETTDTRIQCPCNMSDDDDGTIELFTCQYCGYRQHSACYGLRVGASVRTLVHCCVHCSDIDPSRTPTDRRLASLTDKRRECLCIFRRALLWCYRIDTVGSSDITNKFNISQLNANKLIKLLHSHGVIQLDDHNDLRAPRPIIREQLEEVMTQFFQNENPDIVDRLIAQTLHQTNTQDPVADVLSPMEKVSIKNDTTIGRIVKPESVQRVVDETLKEYRDAIIINEDKENDLPPLSGSHNPINVEHIGNRTVKRKLDISKRNGVVTKRVKSNRDTPSRKLL